MEHVANILIILHAGFGGFALLTGLIALIVRKGSNTHKKTGLIFYYTMLSSAISSLIIAVLPNHENPFLFAIGIFSSYFILTGKRALKFKNINHDLSFDKLISWVMIITGFGMIIYPILIEGNINIVLFSFGILGIILSFKDLKLFKNRGKLKKDWLKSHLVKMVGGYISATTAFLVVNNLFPSVYGWFIPSIIGGIYIAYWIKRTSIN